MVIVENPPIAFDGGGLGAINLLMMMINHKRKTTENITLYVPLGKVEEYVGNMIFIIILVCGH